MPLTFIRARRFRNSCLVFADVSLMYLLGGNPRAALAHLERIAAAAEMERWWVMHASTPSIFFAEGFKTAVMLSQGICPGALAATTYQVPVCP